MKKLKTRAEIDLSALKNNFKLINEYVHSHSPDCDMICVVKADAYGHGVDLCIPALAEVGATNFAVSCIEEATQVSKLLNTCKCNAKVLILGPTDVDYISEISESGIIQTVCSEEYAIKLHDAAVQNNVTIDVAIKLDTGMNRIGYSATNPKETLEQLEEICKLPNLNVVSLFTHFACADEPNDTMTQAQYEKFSAIAKPFKNKNPNVKLQCCNSAAALRYPDMHLDAVRIGLILYGLAPERSVTLPGLRPVMSLHSTITHIHKINCGESVSYGATYTAERNMTVATVGIGYGDGFLRACANGGHLIVNGSRAKILGRICMDQCMIDISDIPARIGDDAVIFDAEGQNIEALAEAANTINYELLCLLSPRVKRIPV